MLPSITDLADLLVQMTDFEIPVNGGEQSVCMSLFLKIQKECVQVLCVDHDMDYWVYDNENVKLDIEAINVPRLLTNVSEQTWQGFLKALK